MIAGSDAIQEVLGDRLLPKSSAGLSVQSIAWQELPSETRSYSLPLLLYRQMSNKPLGITLKPKQSDCAGKCVQLCKHCERKINPDCQDLMSSVVQVYLKYSWNVQKKFIVTVFLTCLLSFFFNQFFLVTITQL